MAGANLDPVIGQIEALETGVQSRFRWYRLNRPYRIRKGVNSLLLTSEHDADTPGLEPLGNPFVEDWFEAGDDFRDSAQDWYDPASSGPALFRELADLPQDTESVVRFMEDWGPLQKPQSFFPATNLSEICEPIRMADCSTGMRCEQLLEDVAYLKELVDVWDWSRTNNQKALRKFFDIPVRKRRPLSTEQVAEIQRGSGRAFAWAAEGLASGDLTAMGLHHVVYSLNIVLRDACGPMVIGSEERGRFQIEIVPSSLMGFIWLQFANAFTLGKTFRRCAVCEKWMELSPGQGRPDKRYCSDGCRMRAYRARKTGQG